MKITKFIIKNSTTVFVCLLLVVLFGLSAYLTMPREAAPDIAIPVVIVNTVYVGVSPSDIETLITNPLEKKLKGLENVEEIRSTSGDSFSSIVIQFTTNVDVEDAVRKVKDKVDQVKKDLPADANEPNVIEINLSDIPIMVVNVSGEYDPAKLKKVADRIKNYLEPINGVLDIKIAGGLEREIQVIPDPKKLSQYKISLDRISRTLAAENMNIPGGVLDIGNSKYLIRIPSELKSLSTISNLVISTGQGGGGQGASVGQAVSNPPIYLRDVADVLDAYKDVSSYSRMNFRDSVSLSIQKRSGENVIRISDEIKKRLKEIEPSLPPTTKINVITDQSIEIKDMVTELENSLLLALILVCVVLFMFLGFTNSVFISIAVPLSMLIGFIILHYFMGVTLNMVVLFSLILALGMLVDDSIVVVENIYRFLEKGYSRYEAAVQATQEVAWPVFGATLTIIAAFFPLLFIPGIAGKFMWYLPVGVMVTISASLFVALFVNPVIAAHFIRLSSKHRQQKGPKTPNRFMIFYERTLHYAIYHRKTTITFIIFCFIFSIVLYSKTSPGVEFFPEVTPDKVYIDITAPESYTLEATNQATSIIEKRLKANANIQNIITTVGLSSGWIFLGGAGSPNQARIIAEFKNKKYQTEDPLKTIEWIRSVIQDIPGIQVNIQKEGMGPPSSGSAISIQISGPDYKRLAFYADQIKSILLQTKGVVDIKDNFIHGKPEILIDVDREKANILGVNSILLASTIRTSVQGSKISVFRENADEYDITLRLPKPDRNSIQRIEELSIFNTQGQQIPLHALANIQTSGGIGAIQHTDAKRVVTVEAKPAKGYYSSERLKVVKEALKSFPLDDGYAIDFAGENKTQSTMAAYLQKAFFITLLLILLVLVVEFNSIVLPFIIMSSIILSLIGILFGLCIFHKPFGIIMTGIGIISLAGIVVRNGIILIQYIRQLREEGLDKYTAVIQGGKTRVRPVLLTAATAVLGLVPMTFGLNFNFKYFFAHLFLVNPFSNFWTSLEFGSQSAEFWGSMGSAMTIGLTVGTILTLVVVPVLYISLDNLIERFKKPDVK